MNMRDKTFAAKVHTQVAVSRATKPATRFIRKQRDAHRAAVDEKINNIAQQHADKWREESAKAESRIDQLQEMLGMNR